MLAGEGSSGDAITINNNNLNIRKVVKFGSHRHIDVISSPQPLTDTPSIDILHLMDGYIIPLSHFNPLVLCDVSMDKTCTRIGQHLHVTLHLTSHFMQDMSFAQMSVVFYKSVIVQQFEDTSLSTATPPPAAAAPVSPPISVSLHFPPNVKKTFEFDVIIPESAAEMSVLGYEHVLSVESVQLVMQVPCTTSSSATAADCRSNDVDRHRAVSKIRPISSVVGAAEDAIPMSIPDNVANIPEVLTPVLVDLTRDLCQDTYTLSSATNAKSEDLQETCPIDSDADVGDEMTDRISSPIHVTAATLTEPLSDDVSVPDTTTHRPDAPIAVEVDGEDRNHADSLVWMDFTHCSLEGEVPHRSYREVVFEVPILMSNLPMSMTQQNVLQSPASGHYPPSSDTTTSIPTKTLVQINNEFSHLPMSLFGRGGPCLVRINEPKPNVVLLTPPTVTNSAEPLLLLQGVIQRVELAFYSYLDVIKNGKLYLSADPTPISLDEAVFWYPDISEVIGQNVISDTELDSIPFHPLALSNTTMQPSEPIIIPYQDRNQLFVIPFFKIRNTWRY